MTQRKLYTEKHLHRANLHREAFTHIKLLHTNVFRQRNFYTEQAFTRRSFYTEKLLHKQTFPQSAQQGFTQRNFCREALTQKLHKGGILHRATFTQRSFDTEQGFYIAMRCAKHARDSQRRACTTALQCSLWFPGPTKFDAVEPTATHEHKVVEDAWNMCESVHPLKLSKVVKSYRALKTCRSFGGRSWVSTDVVQLPPCYIWRAWRLLTWQNLVVMSSSTYEQQNWKQLTWTTPDTSMPLSVCNPFSLLLAWSRTNEIQMPSCDNSRSSMLPHVLWLTCLQQLGWQSDHPSPMIKKVLPRRYGQHMPPTLSNCRPTSLRPISFLPTRKGELWHIGMR